MRTALLLAAILTATVPAQAQYGRAPVPAGNRFPEQLRDVGLDQRLDEQVPLGLSFRDEAGRTVRLGDLIRGKPVVLVLAQYRCPMLCTQVLNGLVKSLRGIAFNAGDQFHVVTVSFDVRETPELAAAKKASYVESYGRPGAEDGWHFLTGDQAAIDRLAEAVGFRYTYDPKQDQFAHASGVIVLTAEGQLSRYFYGLKYPSRDLRLGLVEASANKIGSPVDQIMLFCFHYDPDTGTYRTTMNAVRVGGVVTLVVLGSFLFVAWRRELRQRGLRFAKGKPIAATRAG